MSGAGTLRALANNQRIPLLYRLEPTLNEDQTKFPFVKESLADIPASGEDQQRFWNWWNTERRVGNWKKSTASTREASAAIDFVRGQGRTDLKILEVGCGSGWLCTELAVFGDVIGTDIADQVLGKAAAENPHIQFVAGDFLTLEFPTDQFDIVVTLEVLAHVEDQAAFIEKIARVLQPGGYFFIATQNRVVLSRWSEVVPQAPGQIRNWLDATTLKKMLARHFEICQLTSAVPVGDRGFLRLVNSYKVNKLLSLLFSQKSLDALKERCMLGHSLIAVARKAKT